MRKVYITAKQALSEIQKAKDYLTKSKNINNLRFGDIKKIYEELMKAERHISLRSRLNDPKRKDYEQGYFLRLVRELK